MLRLSVVRDKKDPSPEVDAYHGRLFLNGKFVADCFERFSLALPVGVYPVSIRGDAPGEKISPALKRKVVWFEANRGWTYLHASSSPLKLKGCVGVLKRSIEDWVYDQVEAELAAGGSVDVTIHQLE